MFDRHDVVQKGFVAEIVAADTSLLRFWILENNASLTERYAIVFDVPEETYFIDPCDKDDRELHAVTMDRLGHTTATSTEEEWLAMVLKNSVTPQQGNGFHAVPFSQLPNRCQNTVMQQVERVLLGTTDKEPMNQVYRVTLQYKNGSVVSEPYITTNQQEAVEVATAMAKDATVIEVRRVNYVPL